MNFVAGFISGIIFAIVVIVFYDGGPDWGCKP
jgi:hypothetical protein